VIDIWRKPHLVYEEELPFELLENCGDKDLAGHVQYSLNKLDCKYKDIILLKIFNDMTFKEIGKMFGESMNTISSRYRRGLGKLKRHLCRG
jgi:RNA polymerase sigma factor (sigma-70 family)